MAWGLLLSVFLHLVLFLAFDGFSVHVPAGDPAAGPREGPPADALVMVRVREATASPAPSRVEPEPTPRRIEPEPAPVVRTETLSERPVTFRFASAEPGGGSGAPEGAGDEASGGSGADRREPVPRSLVPQWDPPEEVRGMRVTVRVHVDARGRPTGAVELHPPTPDAGFNEALTEKVRRMEYSPAREDGRAVPGWAEITFVF